MPNLNYGQIATVIAVSDQLHNLAVRFIKEGTKNEIDWAKLASDERGQKAFTNLLIVLFETSDGIKETDVGVMSAFDVGEGLGELEETTEEEVGAGEEGPAPAGEATASPPPNDETRTAPPPTEQDIDNLLD